MKQQATGPLQCRLNQDTNRDSMPLVGTVSPTDILKLETLQVFLSQQCLPLLQSQNLSEWPNGTRAYGV